MKQVLLMSALVMGGCGKSKEEETAKTKGATKGVQCQFCGNMFPAADVRMHELKCPKNATDQSSKPANHPKPNPQQPETTSEKLITDPIVEKKIRVELKKPKGELTKADLEKVTILHLENNQLTDVKGLEKLTKLEVLNLQG
ncbi:MAG: leucine-rich repeat domain-containing protein, partial [Verrucomicrobiota bacterium]|nr:leucine-rich repeat domain-containing protein [Verrucomicrobiota bacterium]